MGTNFGLITEGPTDQVVLKNLLAKYFSNLDIDTRSVQPNVDSTDETEHFGGWTKVLEYCKSADMKVALEVYDYIIIQMDTDVCEAFGVQKRAGGINLTGEEIVERTKALIIGQIGAELYQQYEYKIIFAISHESIECWLLPLYYDNNVRTKTINCCETLNQELKREGFTIDCNSKKPNYHQKVCKNIKNKTHVESMCVHNDSFNQLIQRLATI